MNKVLRVSFSLRNTYRVNCIIYSIKQIPILNRLLPESLYRSRGLKLLAGVLSLLWEIAAVFLGKLMYFLLMFFEVGSLYEQQNGAALFLHFFVFLTIIGAFSNTFMFNPTKDKYYAMVLLRMDARAYTLVDYSCAILKVLVGFGVVGIWFGFISGVPLWQCVLIPFCVAGIKMAFAAFSLRQYEKSGRITDENKLGRFQWVVMLLLLAAAYGLPVKHILLPASVSVFFMACSIAAGILSVKKITSFVYYREVYQQMLADSALHIDAGKIAVEEQQKQSRKAISLDRDITSKSRGFVYLNELFIKRHQKLLWKSAERISAFFMLLVLGGFLIFYLKPEWKGTVNDSIMGILPGFLFVMYAINRGADFTRVLFINCDHSLLNYSFYKQPGAVLTLYQLRLRELIWINLVPAAVIGVGLALLLWLSGGTDNPQNYVILIVSILSMSVFFSVHYLTIYYLLQPYNAGSEIKSATYQIVTGITGLACYALMSSGIPIHSFGIVMIVFCIIYCVIARVLVYFLAPKTFRIRA